MECLNDKLVAFQHQRKVNKMLASRIQDLEKQLENLTRTQVSPILTASSPSSLRLPEPIKPTKSSDLTSPSPLIKFDPEEKSLKTEE